MFSKKTYIDTIKGSIDTIKCKSIPSQCFLFIPLENITEPVVSKFSWGVEKEHWSKIG